MIWRIGVSDHRSKFAGVSAPGKALEDLHGVDAGLELPDEIGDRGRNEPVDQRLHEIRVAVRHDPGRREFRRALARDHVARHGPGSAAEAEQGGLGRQTLLHPTDGFEDGCQAVEVDLLAKLAEFGQARDRRQPRPFALGEADRLAQSVGNDKDVAEQDGCIQPEPPDRLKGRLRRHAGRVAEVHEGLRFALSSRYSGRYRPACRMIQIGGSVQLFACQDTKERFGRSHGGAGARAQGHF